MLFDYLITGFKVLFGLATNERLTIIALIALAVMLIWVIVALVFSFQAKFSRGARKINEFISRNGLDSKGELNKLIAKMPSEFIRGYNAYQVNPKTLPSEHIKRFDSLDVELNGGVFNQNKSALKTYTRVIFIILMLFSFAIIPQETSLTGYLIAEAFVLPFVFMLFAKIIYYIYTAIRQHQYSVAVEEFNEMLDNMDKASIGYGLKNISAQENKQNPPLEEKKQEIVKSVEFNPVIEKKEKIKEEQIVEKFEDPSDKKETEPSVVREENKVEEKEEDIEVEEIKEIVEDQQKGAEDEKEVVASVDELLKEDELVQEKRKRGRPRKEISDNGEFVIKNDKEFEEALVRAEKLMRKNEEPLSASQTKRIEKQIKELVDAMTKYKEGK